MALRKFVLLVAGHSTTEPGAVGQGSTEAHETIQITDRVYNLLLDHPNILVEKAPHEQDYIETVSWSNRLYPNLEDGLVVEIHKNAFNSSASGNEVLIPAGSDGVNQRLAGAINGQLAEVTGLPNRGVKERGDLYLISAINMYACLVEAGFVDKDPIDDTADSKFALAIYNGICDFFGEPRTFTGTAPVVPAPGPLYRVMKDGKQLGAYNVDINAWAKYQANPGSIILDGTGADVTGKFVEKFTPPIIIPDPIQPPVVDEPDYAKENNGLLKWIIDLLKKIFNIKE